MNSRQRVMAALNLEEPDRVPFMDFVDNVVKQKSWEPGRSTKLSWLKKSEWMPFIFQTTARRYSAKAIMVREIRPRRMV